MNLRFGCDKCEKMHVGKKINEDICQKLTIDLWEEKLEKDEDGKEDLVNICKGKTVMKVVEEKKYLGDIIMKDGKNQQNIKARTNKAQGNLNKIVTSLSERPYGRHTFKAAKLMRETILLGGLLTNSKSWINITKKNIEDLEKQDILLQRKILSISIDLGKP